MAHPPASAPGGVDPQLLDLLVEWEERRAADTSATPDDLCRRWPERAADLRRHAGQIARLDSLLALVGGAAPVTRPTVPGFELLGEIGRGGMGVVYKARDLALDRLVAVKVPFAAAAGGLSGGLFEQEARTLAKLRHPGIVPVHAAGVAGDTPYLVMEYVPGRSLEGRLAEAAGTPARAARLVAQVAEAVGHAHAAGVVHRDLKPSNILLTEAGRPVVGDFGVAALLAGEPVVDRAAAAPDTGRPPRLTRTGVAVGTPEYAAPECGRGPPTPAADVWSLGVILYQCLTGRLPYPGTGVAGGVPPPRPRAVQPGVPRGLEAVTLRCLAIDPAARYPTAAAVAAALTRWDWRRRIGRMWAAAAGAVLVVLALALGAAVLARPPDPAAQTRSAKEGLVRGEAVTLVSATGAPLDPRVRVGDAGRVRMTTHADGTLAVDAGSAGPVLVELLDDTMVGGYRYAVDVRQDECDGEAMAGVYYAHQAVPTAVGPVHLFGRLQFPDLGPAALTVVTPGGTRTSLADLAHLCLPPPWARRDELSLAGGARQYRPPNGPPAARWHNLAVEVTDTTVRGSFDGEPLDYPVAGGSFRFGDVNAWARQLPVLVPALRDSQVRVIPRGAVGLFVSRCRASFRNGRIEPVPVPVQ